MFRFFRLIRQQLFTESKFHRYLIYAIGEIVLVVIGILIALQINNWNEQKSTEARLLSVFREIKLDLEEDIMSSYWLVKKGKEQDSLVLKVLNQELTFEDYKNDESYGLFWLGISHAPFVYQNTGFTKLQRFEGIFPEKYEQLVEVISRHYNKDCEYFDKAYSNLQEIIKERHDYLVKNYDWYYLLKKEAKTDEMISFYLDDPIYKNWIFQSYSYDTNGKNGALENLRNSAWDVLILLSDLLESEMIFSGKYLSEIFGYKLTTKESEVAGKYVVPSNGRKFSLEVKSGYLMFDGVSTLKKISEDHYQSIRHKDWFYKAIRDDAGKIIEFKMQDTGNAITYKCEKVK
jgi:hypothetical protein